MKEFIVASLKAPSSEQPDSTEHKASVFIRRAHQLRADLVLAPPIEGGGKSYGDLWPDATPQDDGRYHFHIGAELPFLLPEIDGPEQTFDSRGRLLVLSNRMVRAYYGPGAPGNSDVHYMLVHRAGLERVMRTNQLGDYYPLPLKSFISSDFTSDADSAHEALTRDLDEWIGEFVQSASLLLDAYRMADPVNSRRLSDITSPASFRGMWVAVDSDGLATCHQLTKDLRLSAHVPHNDVSAEGKSIIASVLDGSTSIYSYKISLASAHNQAHFGSPERALIDLATACESYLSIRLWPQIKADLMQLQSPTKWERRLLKKGPAALKYYNLLNKYSIKHGRLGELSNHLDVIDKLDWARERRNDVVHSGNFTSPVSRGDVENALDAAVTLINYLVGLHPESPFGNP